MMRMYDVAPRGGGVSLNGVDVRELRRDSVSDAVAAIPQNVSLVNDTISANISFGWYFLPSQLTQYLAYCLTTCILSHSPQNA